MTARCTRVLACGHVCGGELVPLLPCGCGTVCRHCGHVRAPERKRRSRRQGQRSAGGRVRDRGKRGKP